MAEASLQLVEHFGVPLSEEADRPEEHVLDGHLPPPGIGDLIQGGG